MSCKFDSDNGVESATQIISPFTGREKVALTAAGDIDIDGFAIRTCIVG